MDQQTLDSHEEQWSLQRTTILRLEALVERQAKALDATDADGAATEELLDRLARALRGVAELRRRPPAQPHSFHQHTGPLAESRSGRADLGDQRSIGELIPSDLVQRGAPFRAAQVGHIVEAERYDGLTPVTMTL